MPGLEGWTSQENSINRVQRKAVVTAGSFSGKVIFVHNVSSLSELPKDL